MSEPLHAQSLEVPPSVDRVRQRALVAGIAGVAALAVGFVLDRQQVYQSWLEAFIFWTGLSLGCLALMMIHHLSGGAWGLLVRRLLEAGARTLPLMGLFFLPLVTGLPYVYEWARPEVVARDPILQWKAPFLNPTFWTVRTVVYFALWGGMAYLLTRWSSEQDASRTLVPDGRFQRVSGPGLVVYGLTVSLASVDWMMSVDPHWFSTIYGFVMMAGQGLTALGFLVLCLLLLMRERPMAGVVQPKHFHDLGKLTFAFVMLYAYLTFSQFLIIWMANLPEEIPWYITRMSNGWQYLFGLLVLGHFAVPFAILLSADVKKSPRMLSRVAVLLLVMRVLDIHFQVSPQFHERITYHWTDLAAVVGMGGLWIAAFCRYLKGRAVLPVHDPYFEQAFADHGSH